MPTRAVGVIPERPFRWMTERERQELRRVAVQLASYEDVCHRYQRNHDPAEAATSR